MSKMVKTTFSIPIEVRDKVQQIIKNGDIYEPDTLSKFYLVAVLEKLNKDTHGKVTEDKCKSSVSKELESKSNFEKGFYNE